jgi:hypothetical protein
MQNKKAYEHGHHGHAEIIRHSPRNGFTTYNVISPVIGLCCHRRLRKCSRKLDASVEASEPHDFVVRDTRAPSSALSRPPHLVPNVRDDRERPSWWDEMRRL